MSNKPSKTINQKLKEFREKAGLTAEELSDLTGISFHTIHFIEQGRIVDPKFTTVERLFKGLGVRMHIHQKSFSQLDQIQAFLKSKKVM